jgi:hypothetical protein
MMKRAGSGAGFVSTGQRYGSTNPDPYRIKMSRIRNTEEKDDSSRQLIIQEEAHSWHVCASCHVCTVMWVCVHSATSKKEDIRNLCYNGFTERDPRKKVLFLFGGVMNLFLQASGVGRSIRNHGGYSAITDQSIPHTLQLRPGSEPSGST